MCNNAAVGRDIKRVVVHALKHTVFPKQFGTVAFNMKAVAPGGCQVSAIWFRPDIDSVEMQMSAVAENTESEPGSTPKLNIMKFYVVVVEDIHASAGSIAMRDSRERDGDAGCVWLNK